MCGDGYSDFIYIISQEYFTQKEPHQKQTNQGAARISNQNECFLKAVPKLKHQEESRHRSSISFPGTEKATPLITGGIHHWCF